MNGQSGDGGYSLVARSSPTLCNPMTGTLQALSVGFPRQDSTGVGCHFLLQGIFPTQGSNLRLLLAGRFFATEPPRKPSEWLNNALSLVSGIRPKESNRSVWGRFHAEETACVKALRQECAYYVPGRAKSRGWSR